MHRDNPIPGKVSDGGVARGDAAASMPVLSRRWRLARAALLLLALGLGFLGYLRPDLQVQWANLAAMCGF